MKNNLFKKFTKGLAMLAVSISLFSQIFIPSLNEYSISILSEEHYDNENDVTN